MLNPDGAEVFQRRNAQFIDINRDAQALSTPEGQLLKKLRDEWQPDIGFNLHNQNPLTTVGKTKKQATISLLAVSGSLEGKSYDGHERNKRLCTMMINALNQFIKGNLGRYDDEYNPRAFGDRISEWGTPVILIETGALHDKDEMFLIKLNFIAYLTALQSLVDGSEKKADPKIYETLPFNDDGDLFNYVFRGATIVPESGEPFAADVAVMTERRRAGEEARMIVREVGDLGIYQGLEEFDMKDYYLVPSDKNLRSGSPAQFKFFKKSRPFSRTNLIEPDKVFVNGKWSTVLVQ